MTAPPLTDAERATVTRADEALDALDAVVKRSAAVARRLLAEPILLNPPKADTP